VFVRVKSRHVLKTLGIGIEIRPKKRTQQHPLVIKDSDKYKTRTTLGKMYLFGYKAKHEATLPYYDRFPIIFPIGRVGKRLLGINFHYLSYKPRAILMDSLYELANNTKYDETTKLKMTYATLNSVAKSKLFKPTVHSYLASQLRTKFVEIPSADWDTAIFLKIQDFGGVSASKVWADSKRKSR